jgi:RNA polymerase sigma factor (sigma-70 family)
MTDEALMQAYAKGDMAAFERLYARYRGPLYRYILRHVGDAATANDLYQGSWEKVIRAKASYTANAPLRAWIFRVAHNHVVDHFRRTRPMQELTPETERSNNPGPEQALADEQQAADLAAAVSALPAEQRDALLLKMEAGLDLAAIARVTGVNEETAKSRLRYAVARLKRSLGSPRKESRDEP